MGTQYVLPGRVLLGLAGCSGLDGRTSGGSFSGGSAEPSPPITSTEPRRGGAGATESLVG